MFKRFHLPVLTVHASDTAQALGCRSGRTQAGVLSCRAAGAGYYGLEMATSMNDSVGGREEGREKAPALAGRWKMNEAGVLMESPRQHSPARSLGAAGAFPEASSWPSVGQDLLRGL